MKKYKNKIIAIASVVLAGIMLILSVTHIQTVHAASRLYGVQQVVDALTGKDYNILEIVPDNALKSFGYVVAKDVPELDDKLIRYGTSQTARINNIKSYFSSLKSRGIVSYGDDLYTERLYTIVDDTYRAVDIPTEEYHESRKGSYVKASLVPGAYGNYMYSPAVGIEHYLKSVKRDGVELNIENGYYPKVGDVVTFTLDISANHAGELQGRTFNVSLKNATNDISIVTGGSISYSNKKLTTNVDSDYVLLDYTYVIAYGDANKTLEFQFSTDGKYYSNICALKVPVPVSRTFEASVTAKAEYVESSTLTLESSNYYEGKYHWSFRIQTTNTSSHKVRGGRIRLTSAASFTLDEVWAGNIQQIDEHTLICDIPLYSEFDETEPGQLTSDISFSVTTDILPLSYSTTLYNYPVLSLDYTLKSPNANTEVKLICGDIERNVIIYSANDEYNYVVTVPVENLNGTVTVTAKSGTETYAKEINYSEVAQTVELTAAAEETEGEYASIAYNNQVYIEDFVPAPGIGTYVWVDDPVNGTTTNVYFNTFYCDIHYTGSDKFATDILELSPYIESELALHSKINVLSYTPAELDHALRYNEIEMSNIDMIYISDSSILNIPAALRSTFTTYSVSNDIDWDTAFNIFEYVSNTFLPIIIDRSILNDWSEYDTNLTVPINPSPTSGSVSPAASTYPVYDEPAGVTAARQLMADGCNIVRLGYILRNYIVNSYVYVESDSEDIWTDSFINTIVSCGYSGGVNIDYGKYGAVTANVFINGLRDGSAQVNALNADINTVVANYWEGFTRDSEIETRLRGAKNIAGEIEVDNFYNNANGEVLTSDYEFDGEYEKISLYGHTFLRYIINFAQKRLVVYKDRIRILDIEPTKFSTLTVDKVKKWISGTAEADKILEYEIVQMNTYEFSGKIEDIVEEYDLIYIGDCIGDGSTLGSMNQSGGKTVYNDTSMNGLIYTHVGDLISNTKNKYAGLLDVEQSALTSSSGKMSTRFSGNDITKDKYNELVQYAISGYPVVISDKFFSSDGTINTAYIDAYSNLYKFMQLVVEGGTYTYKEYDDGEYTVHTKTITSLNNVSREKNEVLPWLVKYINMPKLSIAMVEWPTDYSIAENAQGLIESVTYLEPVNGVYTLRYTFELSNSAETRPSVTSYRVRLYTDTNADGKFNELEELDDLSIIETDTGISVNYDALKTGIRYTISRELPENYVGMIPWKIGIEIADASAYTARTSAKGYTAIKAKTEEIRVLQINGTYFTQYNLNLETNATFQNLISNLRDKMGYDVRIKTTDTTAIVNEYNNGHASGKYTDYNDFYNSYMGQYDMLILGFEDCYSDIASDDVIMAVQSFIVSGKAVLFAHDTTSYINFPESQYNSSRIGDVWKYWGYHMNKFTRALVGMDRFGVNDNALLKALTANVGKGTALYNSIIAEAEANTKDVAYLPDGSISWLTHGFNNYEMANNVPSGAKTFVVKGNQNWGDRTQAITQLNKGQITSYPFNLNIEGDNTRTSSGSYYTMNLAKEEVALTHAQYWQLNMDMDKDFDGTPDLVVWYCLAGKAYDAVPNDAINGYYIYSVGNVTYTGMGHFQDSSSSASKVKIQEAKLFLNTMVASFNSGLKAPSLSITSSSGDKNTTVDYIYRTYDIDGFLEENKNEDIGIYVKDTNIVQALKDVYYWFYYPVTKAEYDAGIVANADKYAAVTELGQTVYLKKYSTNPSDDDYFGNVLEIDPASHGYIANGEIKNDKLVAVTIKYQWIGDSMLAARDSGDSVKLYVGAWTKLTYAQNGSIVKETAKSFSHITFKERELFDLD